ncbi:hypothetical protein DFH06DRAFT_982852 [Mycena polygramma]|nr:hypothetical protein DFH06DRAFT_982852 [Mycena polygramma]
MANDAPSVKRSHADEDDASTAPTKRQRTEETAITRSEIWYKDGSVVLQAQNTQFRVHWTLLAQHSSVFHDMQGLLQPPGQPSVEGCPVVELQDTVVDVEHLLKALYNPLIFNDKALPFPYIASFIRLGRKYEFKGLFDVALERLAFENPTTLEEYAALLDSLEAAAGKRIFHYTTRIDHYSGIYHDMLTLARENELLAILPCAYFRMIAYSLVSIHLCCMGKSRGQTEPPPSCLRRTVLGYARLTQARWKPDNTFGWLVSSAVSEGCTNRSRCEERRQWILNTCLLGTSVAIFPRVQSVEKSFCTACVKVVRTVTEVGSAKMWQDLPSFFDLPRWDELTKSTEV